MKLECIINTLEDHLILMISLMLKIICKPCNRARLPHTRHRQNHQKSSQCFWKRREFVIIAPLWKYDVIKFFYIDHDFINVIKQSVKILC